MGPLADFRGHLGGLERQGKLRWIDNGEGDKQKLRTNNSEDDLIIKIYEAEQPGNGVLTKQENHRLTRKMPTKATIKAFKQSLSEVTGVANFYSLESAQESHKSSQRKR